MTRSHRFALITTLATLAVLGGTQGVLAQGSWSMSGAECRGTTTRNDDLSWPPYPPTSPWDGVGVSDDPYVQGLEHNVSGDGWGAKCWEVTLCKPRVMRLRIHDLTLRPGHNFELWIDGQKIGTTPVQGTWGYRACEGRFGAESNGDWTIGFGTGQPAVAQAATGGRTELGSSAFSPQADVSLPHVEGQVHQIRIRFAGFDGHSYDEIYNSCMILPTCEIRWDWLVPKIVAKGRFAYRDTVVSPTGGTVPMRSIKLQLYDRNPDGTFRTFDGWKATTDANGYFKFPCVDNLEEDGTPFDLMVRAFYDADSSDFPQTFTPPIIRPVRMHDKNRGIWSFDSETKMNAVGDPDHSELDFGTQKPAVSDYSHNTAMHIYSTMLKGWDWVQARVNWQPPNPNTEQMGWTNVVWDWEYMDTSTTTGDSIFIAGKGNRAQGQPDEWDNDVLLHEYGHRVANRYFFNSLAQIPSHSLRAEVKDASGAPSLGGAWDEGWAHFFSRAAALPDISPIRQNWGWDKNNPDPKARSKETINLEDGRYRSEIPFGTLAQNGTGYYNDQGATWEVPVAGALWDMYDDQYKSDNQPGNACGEAYWIDPALIFKACRSKTTPVSDIYSFYHAFVEQNPSAAPALIQLFCEHGIDVTQHGPGQIAQDPPPTVSGDVRLANALLPGRPNPFRVATTIDFSLATPARVDLQVFDVRGRLVRALVRGETRDPGRYSVPWDGRDLTGNAVRPGVYLYRLVTDGFRAEKKLIVIP